MGFRDWAELAVVAVTVWLWLWVSHLRGVLDHNAVVLNHGLAVVLSRVATLEEEIRKDDRTPRAASTE